MTVARDRWLAALPPLGSQSQRRTIVLLAVAVWAVLVSPVPGSLHGAGILLTLALVALTLLLGVGTDWLAFAWGTALDERQAALRDRAYRIAFRLLGLGVVLLIIGSVFAAMLARVQSGNPLPDPIPARRLLALLGLLIAAPTAVIAWLQPDPLDEVSLARRPDRRPWTPTLIIPMLAAAWLFAVAVVPARTTTAAAVPHPSFVSGDASCGLFEASREIAAGLGGSVHVHASVCWNGRAAWVIADPNLAIPPEFRGRYPASSYLTRCSVNGGGDFATVSDLTCTELNDSDGTLHYTVRARMSPGLGDLGVRREVIRLDVAPDGRVLHFG